MQKGFAVGCKKCLVEELGKQLVVQNPIVFQVQLSNVRDNGCRFYLQALTEMQGEPIIGLGEELYGFPVVWVGTNGRWYGSVGLNVTKALRNALQQALLKEQNQEAYLMPQSLVTSSVHLEERGSQTLMIPSYKEGEHSEVLQSALQTLKNNKKRLLVFDMAVEPFFKQELAGVFGVIVREEESC